MTPGRTVAVVDDNADFREAIVEALEESSRDARGFESSESFRTALAAFRPDVTVLDLNLPGEDGIDLCRHLRRRQPTMGIIVLSSRTASDDRVRGYRSGADIYMTKPSSTEEVVAALDALERRLVGGTAPESGDALTLDASRLVLSGPAGRVALTGGEEAILEELSATDVCPTERLLSNRIIGSATKASLEVRIVRLRQKMRAVGGSPPGIKSVRNLGYRLTVPMRIQRDR